jgi:ribosome-associated protein
MSDDRVSVPSRSAAKRWAQRVEELAARALDLSDSEVRHLRWPPELREELQLARRTRSHGARKRQIKHLAALLRRDEEALQGIEDALTLKDGRHLVQVQDFQQLEQLREQLCADQCVEDVLDEIRASFPACDTDKLGALAQSYRDTGDRRHYREIFRLLRAGAEQGKP